MVYFQITGKYCDTTINENAGGWSNLGLTIIEHIRTGIYSVNVPIIGSEYERL